MGAWRSVHVLTAGLLLAGPSLASELGTDLKLHFSSDAIATYGFESPAEMLPLLRQIQASGPTWVYVPVSAGTPNDIFVSDDNAPEGNGYLHFIAAEGLGFTIVDPATFAAIAHQRVQISFWGRSEGMEPVVSVTWGNES